MGAFGLPDYCSSFVCVPEVIEALGAWQHDNNPKTTYIGVITVLEGIFITKYCHSRKS